MCKGRIAKKVGMSRVFSEEGQAIPVTYLQVEPNTVIRLKTEDKDGYNAVVLGVKPKNWKSRKGKENTKYAMQKEWRVESMDGLEPGKALDCSEFTENSRISVTGTSKGRGFQGVMKRHNFAGGPRTHGSHFHRRPGSVGMCEFPGRVLKGKRMPGRMGNDTVTLKNRLLVAVDADKGLLAVKGAIPGPNGSNVFVTLESAAQPAEATA